MEVSKTVCDEEINMLIAGDKNTTGNRAEVAKQNVRAEENNI